MRSVPARVTQRQMWVLVVVNSLAKLRLMGTAEIAELLGIFRQWADVLTGRRDFPEPVAVLKAGRIWLAEDVERYARERRRNEDEA